MPGDVDPKPPVRGVLEPRVHTAFDGIPYFDAELQVPQSQAHRVAVHELGTILEAIAVEEGLDFLSDEPIWYLHPETDEQKVYYGDCVVGRSQDRRRITAESLLLVVEVVSTEDRRKELKDTKFQPLLNEYNSVPEFALAFPEPHDPRALTWYQLDEGHYQHHELGPGARIHSRSVPGLEFCVLPREAWQAGRKLEVRFKGEVRHPLKRERQRAEQEKARAEQEKARAEQEKARAEQEKARAEQEKARAEQEKTRADALAAKLRALGIDPSSPE